MHNCWGLCGSYITLTRGLSKTCIQFHSRLSWYILQCGLDYLLRFSSTAVTWEAPLGHNALRPPPVGGHAFVKFDKHRAVYFSGRRTSGRTNDVYLFDLDARVSSLLASETSNPTMHSGKYTWSSGIKIFCSGSNYSLGEKITFLPLQYHVIAVPHVGFPLLWEKLPPDPFPFYKTFVVVSLATLHVLSFFLV